MKISAGGMEYGKEDSEVLRSEVIGWRDAAMDQWPDSIDFTVAASHLIEWMAGAIERLWPEGAGHGGNGSQRAGCHG